MKIMEIFSLLPQYVDLHQPFCASIDKDTYYLLRFDGQEHEIPIEE